MRVLLVEDEERLAETIREGLSEHGVTADIEHDGREGLFRAKVGSYDVIVLDIMLPGLNGYQICRKLREAEIWTPILMLTAKDGEWDEAEALDTGADDYLSKPFSFVVLLARLRALARRPSVERPAVLQVGDLVFDVASSAVRRGETVIDLTRTELQVLEVLMRAGDTPVPKLEIFNRVWGIDADVDPKIVEVYVRYLRRKVDEPFDVSTIKNLRGVGYRVVAT